MKDSFISLNEGHAGGSGYSFIDFNHMNYNVLSILLLEKKTLFFLCKTDFNSVTIYMLNRYS